MDFSLESQTSSIRIEMDSFAHEIFFLLVWKFSQFACAKEVSVRDSEWGLEYSFVDNIVQRWMIKLFLMNVGFNKLSNQTKCIISRPWNYSINFCPIL